MSTSQEREDEEFARRLAGGARIGGPVIVVGIAIAAGVTRGAPSVVLVLAGGALAAVVALFWQSVRTLVGETPLTGADAFALGTPRAEEERKRAVLRALKDLEFERGVGKISEADYRELVAVYRGEAKRLLQQLDAAAKPRRERVMSLVEDRLRAAGLAGGLDDVRSAAGEKIAQSDDDKAVDDKTDDDKSDDHKAVDHKAVDHKAVDDKTDDDKTDDAETDDAETDDAETDDAETDDAETDDAETDDAETDAPREKGGSDAS